MQGACCFANMVSAPIQPCNRPHLERAVSILGCCAAAQISMDWEMSSVNVLEWKLADVPELGYYNSDRPFPRGELLLKTHSMIKGYYKHPKARRPGARGAARVARRPGPAARTGLPRAPWPRPAATCWLSVAAL